MKLRARGDSWLVESFKRLTRRLGAFVADGGALLLYFTNENGKFLLIELFWGKRQFSGWKEFNNIETIIDYIFISTETTVYLTSGDPSFLAKVFSL